ncbi:MAG: hypothetical protein LBL23_04320 [Coriobacteriales bacterium]|jgi:hypothetical protein|nr:hypothetical protein [Coriobacteriales bacterium]
MLAVLVIGAAGAFLVLGSGLLSQTAEQSQRQVDVTSVAEHVAEELRLASSIRLVTETSPGVGLTLPQTLASDERLLYIGSADGAPAGTGYFYLWYGSEEEGPRNYYGTNYYGSYTVSLAYTVTVAEDGKAKSFEISVAAHNAEGVSVGSSQATSFSLINVTPAAEPLAGEQAVSTEAPFYLLYTRWGGQENGSSLPPTEPVIANGDIPDERDFEWTVPATGTYLLECWGADGGGDYSSNGFMGGIGGYASGQVWLIKGTTVYLNAGEAGALYGNDVTLGGQVVITPPATFGGGGALITYNKVNATDPSKYGGGTTGGGGSDIRVLSNDLNNRIIVAGGGGGAGMKDSRPAEAANKPRLGLTQGGNGGGEQGVDGTNEQGYERMGWGLGATQTEGGKLHNEINTQIEYSGAFYSAEPGGFGVGGRGVGSDTGGAGGGGGWYGGGGGFCNSGGGGSGYVLTEDSYKPTGYFGGDEAEWTPYCLTNTANLQGGNTSIPTKPSTGHGGYVRITWQGI